MRRVACASLLVTLLAAGSARADQRAAAQALFDKGRELALHKNFADACPKFAESQRLDPGLGTMLWLADCWENDGRTASAWALFKEAASVAAAQKDAREAVARRRVAALEPKLTRMVLATPTGSDATPGLTVQRDGLPVSATELGVALPVDPGVHTISASAPGRWPWTANLQVRAQAEPLVVTIPVLTRVEGAVAVATPDANPSDPPALERPRTSPLRMAGITIGAVGLAGLATGVFFGVRAPTGTASRTIAATRSESSAGATRSTPRPPPQSRSVRAPRSRSAALRCSSPRRSRRRRASSSSRRSGRTTPPSSSRAGSDLVYAGGR